MCERDGMKIMPGIKAIIVCLMFFIANSNAQIHPSLLSMVSEKPHDFDPKSHLIASDIEPVSKKPYDYLNGDNELNSLFQACCQTEEGNTVILHYAKKNFETILGKPVLDGVHNPFMYRKKINANALNVLSFAHYIKKEDFSTTKQFVKKWEAIYEPEKKKCCTPMRALVTGTSLVGTAILAIIFINWSSIEKCCAQ
jgi:hypothetical protein